MSRARSRPGCRRTEIRASCGWVSPPLSVPPGRRQQDGRGRISRSALLQAVTLSAVAEEVAESLRALRPGDDVTCKITPGLSANGGPSLLRLALTHMIGTAWCATAGRPGSYIEFGTARVGDRQTFVITDGGGGLDRPYAGALPG